MDERQGKPSASGMERYYACPGSFLMQAKPKGTQLPARAEKDDRDADTGTRIHAADAGEAVALNLAEQDTLMKAGSRREEIITSWMEDNGLKNRKALAVFKEERFWSKYNLYSGRLDHFLVETPHALIIDLKALWGDHAPPAENLQLRAYAVLLWQKYPFLKKIRVVINQPNLGQVAPADYEIHHLERSWVQIKAIIKAAQTPGSPLKEGPHCRYCSALATCPKATDYIPQVAQMHEMVEKLKITPKLLEACVLAKQVAEAVEARARTELKADPEAFPGWILSKGREVWSFDNPDLIYLALKDELTVADWIKVNKPQKGKIKDVWLKKYSAGYADKREAEEALFAKIKPFATIKQASGSLKKQK